MSAIVPRWEWRAFGRGFGGAETALIAAATDPAHDSDETYLLSGNGENVKVREDLIDIKVLREVDADGLQRWEPVLKAGFPLPAADVTRTFEALGLPPQDLGEPTYPLDDLLRLVEQSGVRVVRVHKRRTRSTFAGCMAEVADVSADGRPTRTIAVESTDRAAVIAAVRTLGLAGYRNVSYPIGLAEALDDVPVRYAAIDVGTNSVKFHVGERGGGGWRTIVDRAEMTRLGEGLDETGAIGAEPLERTVTAVAAMVEEAGRNDARAVVGVGTAGMRIARNGAEVAAAIGRRTGVGIEVLPGEEEARLAYLAVTAELGPGEGSRVVFDTGGGSTQFTFGRGGSVQERFSIDVGAVRVTERHGLAGATQPAALQEALAAIAEDVAVLDGREPPDALVAMGGAVTNLAAVKHALATYDPEVVQGTVLDLDEIDRQIELYRSRDADARRGIVGLQPKRAEVILAGACIVRTIMDKLGQRQLTVSDRGLRHGLLLERFGA